MKRPAHLQAIPSAAVYLLVAAVVSDVFPSTRLSIENVKQAGTAALVVILFDGGASIGVRRFREAAATISALGIIGTFATAGLITLFAHWALGLSWMTSGLLGAAIAPTDPAVVFALLGNRGVGGRVGTILEGESGANDPVGIALMLGLLELATHSGETFWVVVRIFFEQIAIGLAVGVLGGIAGRAHCCGTSGSGRSVSSPSPRASTQQQRSPTAPASSRRSSPAFSSATSPRLRGSRGS